MSKMSQLHLTLDEQAVELGFEGLGEALMKGCDIDYEKRTLVDGRELAHEAWVKEREEVIAELEKLYDGYVEGDYKTNGEKEILKTAIDFIKKGEI